MVWTDLVIKKKIINANDRFLYNCQYLRRKAEGRVPLITVTPAVIHTIHLLFCLIISNHLLFHIYLFLSLCGIFLHHTSTHHVYYALAARAFTTLVILFSFINIYSIVVIYYKIRERYKYNYIRKIYKKQNFSFNSSGDSPISHQL